MKETAKQSAKGCLHRMPDGITALDRLEIKPEREAIRQQKIARRTKDIPKIYRKVYEKAVINGNKPAAIKAFCLECVCWQKNEIINCTSLDCPLYAVRPFPRPRLRGGKLSTRTSLKSHQKTKFKTITQRLISRHRSKGRR